ncbi:MAG: threonine-phosphate decarboxylase [Clostridiales bacterium]|nr:threonine-phosphate decarboxylase [Clostridiales bacterium]
MKLIHGGDTEGFFLKYGKEPIDFSANINPFGLPEGVKKAVISALDHAQKYPDPLCRRLTKAISVAESVPEEWILCGNGAADLIFCLCHGFQPQNGLVFVPTFAEYAQALGQAGCKVEQVLLKRDHDFCYENCLIEHVTHRTDLVFLCNPNNPTGLCAEKDFLQRLMDQCDKTDTILVVDECFLSFVPNAFSMKEFVGRKQNLIVLKAFTKLYAMAGLRLGYLLCSNENLIEKIRCATQPWSVSSLAQEAGIAALKEKAYMERSLLFIERERKFLKEVLRKAGAYVYDSQANFIFFRWKDNTLKEKLYRKGILIRSCENYPGLDHWDYRIAVRTEKENRQLEKALLEITSD